MTEPHQLDPDLLDAIASGGGGIPAIEALAAAQLSKHLLLIRFLVDRWPAGVDGRGAAVDALARAQRRDPGPVALLLGGPFVGAWASGTTQRIADGTAADADFGHLCALAGVAAFLAGTEADLPIPVRDGWAAIPTLGAARVGSTSGPVRLRSDGRRLSVLSGQKVVDVPPDPTTDGDDWLGVRPLRAGAGGQVLRLALDDLDPYRHGHHAPPADRLPAAEVASWEELLGQAWGLLSTYEPDRAEELATGLRALVPLHQIDQRSARSATIRHAFGVFGLTRPPSPSEFAVTLVHEFQHSKLSATLDLVMLCQPGDGALHFAPWRIDPRPIGGLFQGVYAFLGVATTWRALRAAPGLGDEAERNFAEARLQVDHALSTLESSPSVTVAGAAFVKRMRVASDELMAEPVAAAAAAAAAQTLERIRQAWTQRNTASAALATP